MTSGIPGPQPLSTKIANLGNEIAQKEKDIRIKDAELERIGKRRTELAPKTVVFGRLWQFIGSTPRLSFLHKFLFVHSTRYRDAITTLNANVAKAKVAQHLGLDEKEQSIKKDKQTLTQEKTQAVFRKSGLEREQAKIEVAIATICGENGILDSKATFLSLPALDISKIDDPNPAFPIDPNENIEPYMTAPIMRIFANEEFIGFAVRAAPIDNRGRIGNVEVQVFTFDDDRPKTWSSSSTNQIGFFRNSELTDHNGHRSIVNRHNFDALKELIRNGSATFERASKKAGQAPKSIEVRLVRQDQLPKSKNAVGANNEPHEIQSEEPPQVMPPTDFDLDENQFRDK